MRFAKLTIFVTTMVAAAGLGLSCSGDKYTGTETFDCPSEAVFTGVPEDGSPRVTAVSDFMARRCGTMDCHGTESRPMRIYGQYGLRHPQEANYSGGKKTTDTELLDNYGAVCTIEPEATAQATEDQGASAESLLVVRKARGIEGHKGGTVIKKGSHGDLCLTGWLRGDDADQVAAECKLAIAEL